MRISIVIPTLNEAQSISILLQSLQAWRACGDEVLIVDGNSSDTTRTLAEPWVDAVLETTTGRAHQLNAGAKRAAGDVIWFIHADSDVRAVSREDIAAASKSPISWGWCTVAIKDANPCFRVIERAMRWRSQITHVATGDQGIFVSREMFERLGGFADIELMEDVEFAKRARNLSKPTVIASRIQTSARRWRKNGIVRTVCLMWSLRLLWWLGVPPARLANAYRAN